MHAFATFSTEPCFLKKMFREEVMTQNFRQVFHSFGGASKKL
jgi:hypothetical protein